MVLMIKKFIYLFILFFFTSILHSHELSICAIFRNEARFLKDWIDFHKKMGVEHFYLYNNLSDDNYLEVLNPYIDSNIVYLIDWNCSYNNINEWNWIQCRAYDNCLSLGILDNCKWVAFIDIDEYLYSPTGKKLTEILKDYEDFGSVCANWVFYGTSNIYEIDSNIPLIFQLTKRAPFEYDEKHVVKSIIQPSKALSFYNPHFCILKEGYLQVDQNKNSFSGPFSPEFLFKSLRINHYWTRDEKFFYEVKVNREVSWWDKIPYITEQMNLIEDKEICQIYESN